MTSQIDQKFRKVALAICNGNHPAAPINSKALSNYLVSNIANPPKITSVAIFYIALYGIVRDASFGALDSEIKHGIDRVTSKLTKLLKEVKREPSVEECTELYDELQDIAQTIHLVFENISSSKNTRIEDR